MTLTKKIVVFGSDNSGKTTAIANISKHLEGLGIKHEVIKSLGPKPDAKEMATFMLKHLAKNQAVVFDRFPVIEEATCGKVLRGVNKFQGYPDNVIASEILCSVDLFIYCRPGIHTILNWGTREQMDGIKDNIYDLVAAYDKLPGDLFDLFNVDITNRLCYYDWQKDKVEKLYKALDGKL